MKRVIEMDDITVFIKNKEMEVLSQLSEALTLTIKQCQNFDSYLLRVVNKVKRDQR
jgi:hypothetical protein